jgi:hypothetical protein
MSDELREYTVTAPDMETTDSIWDDLLTDASTPDTIPQRVVEVANERTNNPRNTSYFLTDAEAEALRQDPRVEAVENVNEIPIRKRAFQDGTFDKLTTQTGEKSNWGLLRHISAINNFGTSTNDPGGTYDYVLDGTGVDVVIVDSGIQADHPEFLAENTAEYVSTAVAADNTNGAVFDRSLTVHGLKIVVAGAVGGQLAVPTVWAEKVGKVVQLLTNPTDAKINLTHQKRLIATLKGDPGTYHAGYPAAQRVAYGGGDSYDPNFLSDAGALEYAGYVDFLDTHALNDMVWYKNTNGPDPSTSDRDIEEAIEHLFHTIHNFGVQGAVPGSENEVVMDPDRKVELDNSFDWTQTEIHLAMKEAITAGKFDPSGYSATYDTDPGAAAVAYKEYTYLLNWGMWSMSQFWEDGSLSPEWSDDMRTPAGIASNNPLGHALFVKYFQPVLSKPNFTTLQSIFQDNDAGASQYTPSLLGYCRVQEIDWYAESGVSGSMPSGFYVDYDGHGTHVAGIVAGKTFGWAKNANIYSIKLNSLKGPSDPVPGISAANAFDCIVGWHNNKTSGNPTVVVNSWSYIIYWDEASDELTFNEVTYYPVTGGSYQGTPHSDTTKDSAKGLTGQQADNTLYVFNYRVASVDADVQTMINSGIIVCNAAGNGGIKQDVSGGQDYDNYVTATGLSNYYYHQGSSPHCNSSPGFEVGSFGTNFISGTEAKSVYSDAGPGVNIYAAGDRIMSAMSITNIDASAYDYHADAGYKQQLLSGTSMAAPQIAGMCALLLQAHRDWTPTQVVGWMQDKARPVLHSTGQSTDYAVTSSLYGGPNRLAWMPMNGQKVYSISEVAV